MTQSNDPSTNKSPSGAVTTAPTKVGLGSCLIAILLLVGMTVLGGAGGAFVGITMPDIFPSGAWQRLDLGQEQATGILGADSRYRADSTMGIYIGTESGDVYSCWMEAIYPRPENRCVKVTTGQIPQERSECPTRHATPPPPGEVVDSLCYPMAFSQSYIVVLSDSNIWEWNKYFGEFGGLTEILSGAGIGLLAGIVAAVLWVKHRGRPRRSNN